MSDSTDSRSKILNAASELFLEGGVACLSVRAIASRAGLSTIGIYSHFNGKQGVLDTLYIEGFELVYKAMDVQVEGQAQQQHIITACENYLDVAINHEAHYRLIFGESGTEYRPSEEAREAADRALAKLVSNMGEYLQSNKFEADRFATAMDLWATLHGYVSISHHTRAAKKWDWRSMALDAVKRMLKSVN